MIPENFSVFHSFVVIFFIGSHVIADVSFLFVDVEELISIKESLDERITVMSTKLVRQLKQRNRLRDKNKRYCDTITAVLQAVSRKRSKSVI